MANSSDGPKPLVFNDTAPAAPVVVVGPKPLSFENSAVCPKPAASAALSLPVNEGARPEGRTPAPLSFANDMHSLPEVDPVKPLFAADEHPAMRSVVAAAKRLFPDMYRRQSHAMDAHFRRLLPIRVETVSTWSEKQLTRGPELAHEAATLIQRYARLGVQELLSDALDSAKPAKGLIQGLLKHRAPPSQFLLRLHDARAALESIRVDAVNCSREVQGFGDDLAVQLCSLAAIADVAGQAPDETLADALAKRRQILQQTVQQAGLSILQLAELCRQAVDLAAQITSFITVTMPALSMAQAQRPV